MVLPLHTITKSAEATQKLGETLGHTLLADKRGEAPRVLCLWGELGSGKTTFTQGLARGLGITSRLPSPTFIIVRRYSIPKTTRMLYHMDLYRVQGTSDIEALGFDEMRTDPAAYVVIEWPERLGMLLPDTRVDIRFAALPDGSHTIEMELTK